MATAAESIAGLPQAEASQELARSWKKLTRAATIVAVLTSPVLYIWFTQRLRSSSSSGGSPTCSSAE